MLHTQASLRPMTVSNLSSRIWTIDAAFKERNAKWHDVIFLSSEELQGIPSTAAQHERGKENPVNYMLE